MGNPVGNLVHAALELLYLPGLEARAHDAQAVADAGADLTVDGSLVSSLPLPRRGHRRGGGGARLGELQRLERIDQAGAEIVVAVARRRAALRSRSGCGGCRPGVSFGLRSSSSATMPLTSAAATDVPVVIW